MESLFKNWDWFIAGPLIGLFVPLMFLTANKFFGISSSFLHICSIMLPRKKLNSLKYNWEENSWKFYFVIGILIGAFISVNFLSNNESKFLPEKYFSFMGFLQLFIGGILVGFGTRYANGCTSGHSITGLATLQISSLKATISFFIGGLIYTFSSIYL